jgi:hypothetical protein
VDLARSCLSYRSFPTKASHISLTRIEIGEDGRVSWLKESPQVAKVKNFALVTWFAEECVIRGPFKILADVIQNREATPIRDMVGKDQLFVGR